MTPTKKQTIIFTAVIIVATVLVLSQIGHDKQAVQKSSAPMAIEKIASKPIQSPEPIAQEPETAKEETKPKQEQLSKAAPKAEEITKPIVAKAIPVPKTAIPTGLTIVSPVGSESASETFTEEPENFRASPSRHHGIVGYNRRAVPKNLRNPAPMPNAAEYNRHRAMFNAIRPYLQTPTSNYTQQQIEQLNAALAEKLPEKYGKMVLDLEVLKEQELAKRKQQMRSEPAQTDVNDLYPEP